jgi:hypothetical protein
MLAGCYSKSCSTTTSQPSTFNNQHLTEVPLTGRRRRRVTSVQPEEADSTEHQHTESRWCPMSRSHFDAECHGHCHDHVHGGPQGHMTFHLISRHTRCWPGRIRTCSQDLDSGFSATSPASVFKGFWTIVFVELRVCWGLLSTPLSVEGQSC